MGNSYLLFGEAPMHVLTPPWVDTVADLPGGAGFFDGVLMFALIPVKVLTIGFGLGSITAGLSSKNWVLNLSRAVSGAGGLGATGANARFGSLVISGCALFTFPNANLGTDDPFGPLEGGEVDAPFDCAIVLLFGSCFEGVLGAVLLKDGGRLVPPGATAIVSRDGFRVCPGGTDTLWLEGTRLCPGWKFNSREARLAWLGVTWLVAAPPIWFCE